MAKKGYGVISSNTKKLKKGYAVIGGVTHKLKRAYAIVNGMTRLCWSADRILGTSTASSDNQIYEGNFLTSVAVGSSPTRSPVNYMAKFAGKYWAAVSDGLYYSTDLSTWTRVSLPHSGYTCGILASTTNYLTIVQYTVSEGADGDYTTISYLLALDANGQIKLDASLGTHRFIIDAAVNGNNDKIVYIIEDTDYYDGAYHVKGYARCFTDSGSTCSISGESSIVDSGQRVAYGNGYWCTSPRRIQGNLLRTRYSTDGTTWSEVQLANDNNSQSAQDIAYFNGRFITRIKRNASEDGTFYTSNPTTGSWAKATDVVLTNFFNAGETLYGFNGNNVYGTTNGTSWILLGTLTPTMARALIYESE